MTTSILVCGCDAQLSYECGGLGIERCEYAQWATEACLAVCEARHEMPEEVTGAIFDHEVNPTEPLRLESKAYKMLRDSKIEYLKLYVTGLTVAVFAVTNACHRLGINVTLMHYDRSTGKYFPQYVRA